MADKPRIGLFIGDPTGIGPEITAKVLTNREIYTKCYPLVIGDDRAFRVGQKIAQTDLKYSLRKDIHEVSISSLDFTFFDLENLDPNKIILGKMSSLSGKAVGDTIKSSIDLATKGIIDAFVYAPINKEALYRGGCPFKAEIDFFAHLLGLTTGFGEMNVLEDLWTSRVTSHISLGEVTKHITRDMVLQAIMLADSTLKRAKIEAPRIGVSALNPHGGEGGLFGIEEMEVIDPSVKAAREMGIDVVGPYPADTIFLRVRKEKLNAIVSMYHDQGQIAMKLMGFEKGVTVNAGLPIVVTTPSHGTAYDIAGKGLANPNALTEALILAVKMAESSM